MSGTMLTCRTATAAGVKKTGHQQRSLAALLQSAQANAASHLLKRRSGHKCQNVASRRV